ncbi:MAG: hypothetical protein ACR2LK_10310 [Solirubrobacteraceae bacterium]
MNTVKILRELWRSRVAVAAVTALAFVLATLATHRPGMPPSSRQYTVGVASARILVDTPTSQVVAVGGLGSESLGQRAIILSAVMVGGDAKAVIARRAGLAPNQLTAVAGAETDAGGVRPGSGSSVHVLTTRLVRDASGSQLPIIEAEARAPGAAEATRLIHAAIEGLNEYLDKDATQQQVKIARRLRVSTLGIVPARTERRGPGLPIAIFVGLLTLFGGCGAIIVVTRVSRLLRDTGEPSFADLPAPAVTPGPRRAPRDIHDLGHPERVVRAIRPPRNANSVAAAPAVTRDVEPANAAEHAPDERSPPPMKAGRVSRPR